MEAEPNEPEPRGVSEPTQGPSRVPEPRPGPSRVSRPRPSRASRPRPSRVSIPRVEDLIPGPGVTEELRRLFPKSDEQLLLEHGIDRECQVVLTDPFKSPKVFQVHYGRHYLWTLSQEAYFRIRGHLDMDRLYKTYITSQFSSLDPHNFRSILRSFLQRWDVDFRARRAQLLKEKVDQLKARRRAEMEARRRFKITYRDQSVIVPSGDVEQAKIALKNSRRTQVRLERIVVDDAPTDAAEATGSSSLPDDVGAMSPQSATDVSESRTALATDMSESLTAMLADGSESHTATDVSESHMTSATDVSESHLTSATDVSESHMASADVSEGLTTSATDMSEIHTAMSADVEDSTELPECHYVYLGDERKEDRRTAITGLIADMINQVSDEQDPDGAASSNPDMSSTDCYSDDTLESPMEVEFESGESPDFSKVLRDSEETCHGDEFYEDAAEDQQGLPTSSADKGSCHQQKAVTRSPDKPSVTKKSKKL